MNQQEAHHRWRTALAAKSKRLERCLTSFTPYHLNAYSRRNTYMYPDLRVASLSIVNGIFTMSKFYIKIWPVGLGRRWTPVGDHMSSWKLSLRVQTHLVNWPRYPNGICQILRSKGQWQFSDRLTCLKAQSSRSQNTKHFDIALRIARDVVNWNFVTFALWPHFLGQGQGHGQRVDTFVHPSPELPLQLKSACQHLELIALHT